MECSVWDSVYTMYKFIQIGKQNALLQRNNYFGMYIYIYIYIQFRHLQRCYHVCLCVLFILSNLPCISRYVSIMSMVSLFVAIKRLCKTYCNRNYGKIETILETMLDIISYKGCFHILPFIIFAFLLLCLEYVVLHFQVYHTCALKATWYIMETIHIL